jgi:hypothetical protein
VVVTQTTALVPGDSLTVVGGAIQDSNFAATGVTVAMASTTVTSLSGAPSATIYAEAAAANDQAKVVYVTFNMAIKDATFDAAGDLVVTDAVVGGTAAILDTCAKIVGFTWACDDAAGGEFLTTGDTVTLAAGKVTSNATVAVKNIASSSVTISDLTAPVLSSATYTALAASTVQANQAHMSVIGLATVDGSGASGDSTVDATKGDVKLQVKAGTALAGRAGNAVKMITDLGSANACTYSAATKTVTVAVLNVTQEAPTIAALCNASATVKDLFIATSTALAGDYDMAVAADSGTATGFVFTGGLDQFDVTLTFSEPIGAATAETNFQFTVKNTAVAVADASVAVKVSVVAELQQELNGVMIYTITTANPVSTGLDKVTVDGVGIVDRAGNALLINGVSNVVKMYVQ